MDDGSDTSFIEERDTLASSLKEKGTIFMNMASYIQDSTTPEMLQERIKDCKRSNGMFGGGGDA